MNTKKQKNKENIDEYYYDAMDYLSEGDHNKALRFLKKALKVDPTYVQTHIGLVAVYESMKNKRMIKEHTKRAFEETKKVFPKWPSELPWGILENRMYLRAICYKADSLLDTGEKDKAIGLYRLLLKLNPDDNQGIRYLLAGVYAGLDGKEVNKLFDKGNNLQDWGELENLLIKQNTVHHFWDKPDLK